MPRLRAAQKPSRALTPWWRTVPLVVVDLDVPVSLLVNVLVATHFVGADRGAGKHVFLDQLVHGGLGAAVDDAGDQLALALRHAIDHRLVAHVAIALAAHGAAHNGFVNLDDFAGAAERIITVLLSHVLPNFVAHAPSSLVGDADLALDLFGRDTVARGAEQEHDVEPVAQAGARALERRASGRIDLIAAPLASVGPASLDAVVARLSATPTTVMAFAVAGTHQMIKTRFLSREALQKRADSRGFRAHTYCIAYILTCRNGIITEQVRGDNGRVAKSQIDANTPLIWRAT